MILCAVRSSGADCAMHSMNFHDEQKSDNFGMINANFAVVPQFPRFVTWPDVDVWEVVLAGLTIWMSEFFITQKFGI